MTTFTGQAVRVRVPATSANLGPGFDTLGLALTLHDQVEARLGGRGVDVSVEGEGAESVGRGEDNLVARAARAAFDRLGVASPGLALRCSNAIPHGRGLGSSAAAIVAGVLLARAFATPAEPAAAVMSDADVFGLAVELEGHPDNVAACLAGGLAIAWGDGEARRWARLEPVSSLTPVAFVPEETLPTEQARGLVPEYVSHRDAAANAGRAALLVGALTARPELLYDATDDRLHQPYRAPAMPRAAELLARLRASGVPAVISGAGPTVVALADGRDADSVGGEAGTGWRMQRLAVDREGARVQTVAA